MVSCAYRYRIAKPTIFSFDCEISREEWQKDAKNASIPRNGIDQSIRRMHRNARLILNVVHFLRRGGCKDSILAIRDILPLLALAT
jgi:hypothetical protein